MNAAEKKLNRQIIACAAAIKNGGIVAFPTETVYGLGADVFNESAVKKVFAVKKRPFSDPLIVHIADEKDLAKIAFKPGKYAFKLIEAFWPGPLTLVLRSKKIPKSVNAGGDTVAVRMPDHSVALKFIIKCGVPIAAPSANLFGKLSPVCHTHVKKQLGGLIDGIIEAGRCRIGIESTIVDVTGSNPVILRKGVITGEDIEAVAGVKASYGGKSGKKHPGGFRSHYSPETSLKLMETAKTTDKIDGRYGYVFFRKEGKDAALKRMKNVFFLSSAGEYAEAAANLYMTLHKADSGKFAGIYAERIAEKGIGKAIMDRLKKASAKRRKT